MAQPITTVPATLISGSTIKDATKLADPQTELECEKQKLEVEKSYLEFTLDNLKEQREKDISLYDSMNK